MSEPIPSNFLDSPLSCVFLRHGDKTWARSEQEENPLSERGHRQAQNLLTCVQQNKLPLPLAVWTSPLLRCQQTVTPLAEYYQVNIELKSSLLLHQEEESFQKFHQRIKEVIHELIHWKPRSWHLPPHSSLKDPVASSSTLNSISFCSALYLCSHQDWLYEMMETLTPSGLLPEKNTWPTGRWIILDYHRKQQTWHLRHEGRLDA